MCEYVSCFPLHTSHCMIAMTTTGSNCHSLIIRRKNPWHEIKIERSINFWRLTFLWSTFTFVKIASLCGDICPWAILSVPFWHWIRACVSTCPVSPSTRYAAWFPWRPLAPTAVHWWLQETKSVTWSAKLLNFGIVKKWSAYAPKRRFQIEFLYK